MNQKELLRTSLKASYALRNVDRIKGLEQIQGVNETQEVNEDEECNRDMNQTKEINKVHEDGDSLETIHVSASERIKNTNNLFDGNSSIDIDGDANNDELLELLSTA